MKVLTVFGTRPEAIKMAPVILGLKKEDKISCRVCTTGQHRQMLDQVLDIFQIVPDYDLDLMRRDQDLFSITAKSLLGLRDVLLTESPDLVLVHGDTTTSFAACLAAFYASVPVGHVEAGLRTGNLLAPFPEEANRVLTSRLTTLHFAPTKKARDNLVREGIPDDSIWVTGNTIVDALLWVRNRVRRISLSEWQEVFGSAWGAMQGDAPLILITGHRRENFGQGIDDICYSIQHLATQHPDWAFVYPVHLNPNVQGPVQRALGELSNVHLIQPLDYKAFVYAMEKSTLILTDSGGVQEEAPALGKPVLVMREATERPEAIEAGCARLVGTDPRRIIAEVERIVADRILYAQMTRVNSLYGDGHAAEHIVTLIKDFGAISNA